MFSRSRSRSGTRKVVKAPSRIVAQVSEEFSIVSEGRRDNNFQTTVNKTGYLGDVSSAVGVTGANKPTNNINFKIPDSTIESSNGPNKSQSSDTMTDWNSKVLINKPVNFVDKRYQSCCIDDTNNGTLLFNNTETVIPLNIDHGNKSLKLGTIKNYPLFETSSDDETLKIPEIKRYSTRSRSKNSKKSFLKNENTNVEKNICRVSVVSGTGYRNANESTNEFIDETYSTPPLPQTTTTLGLYSEFKNEYENLLDGSKVLADVSTTDNNKTDIKHPSNENKCINIKKIEKKQPSPIPKERCTEISEIDSCNFKKSSSNVKKNTSAKYNRLTFAEQLEKTFQYNDNHLNISKQPIIVDQLNHTYRNSLEDTLPNFDIKCLANSTCRDESHEKTLYTDTKSQNLSIPYLSRNFVKNLDTNSITSMTQKTETLLKKQHFSFVNDCSTEIVRECSNQKVTNIINTPTTISDLGIKKNETIYDNNIIITTNSHDIHSIDSDNNIENNNIKSNITNEISTKSTLKLDETKNITTNITDKTITLHQEKEEISKKPFINPSIIDDFRDEMNQSINDVCEFLSQKVKNDTAVNLVEERFMENAKFLYKFFFHSCREGN